jgi:hypothetical protein
MALARQRSVVGKRKTRWGSTAKSRAQRAVDKKFKIANYRKNNKRKFQMRRAPFVETKSKTREDLVVQFPGLTDVSVFRTSNTPHVALNPDTFTMWKRGMEENEVIGNSCYAKYLKMKIGIRFPQPAFSSGGYTKIIPMTPQNYELIWGWIPNELGYTGNTTPTADAATIQDINAHINNRVVDYVNEQKDKMRFIPKAASTIRIVGRRKIRPDMRFHNTAPPETIDPSVGSDYAVGTIPDVYTSISWKMGKKLHLQPSSNLHNYGGAQEGLYPNFGTWLPFAVFVNWDYDTLPGAPGAATQAYLPAIQYNDAIWYSDS